MDRRGGELEGKELALVEELVGDAEGGQGAGGERDGELEVGGGGGREGVGRRRGEGVGD